MKYPLLVLSLAVFTFLALAPIPQVKAAPYQSHDPIRIASDADLTPENGVVAGSGTPDDPYVIEGWKINATGLWGINICSVTKHVVIRNCLIYSNSSSYDCVIIRDSQHVRLENCIIVGGGYGVFLSNATDCSISNCTLRGVLRGVMASASSIAIKNCVVEDVEYGISLIKSEGEVVSCAVVDVSNDGIALDKCSSCLVDSCSVENSGGTGIRASGTSINIQKCTVLNSSSGIVLWNASDSNVRYCHVEGCPSGISVLYGAFDVEVLGNEVVGSDYEGIFVEYAADIRITRNNVTACGLGIRLTDANYCLIYDNFFFNKRNWSVEGTCIGNSWNTTICYGCPSIINGPRGGNYWSDYAGEDLDGDGIGDTALPYGPGDWAPLVSFVRIKSPFGGESFAPNETITVTWERTTNVVRVELRINRTSWIRVNGNSYEIGVLPEGVHFIEVRGYDSAGHICQDATWVVVTRGGVITRVVRPEVAKGLLGELTYMQALILILDVAILLALAISRWRKAS